MGGNLNSGRSYLITAVLQNKEINKRGWHYQETTTEIVAYQRVYLDQFLPFQQ